MEQIDSGVFLDQLQQAIESSTGHRGFSCPICEFNEWTVVDGVIPLQVTGPATSAVSVVPVVCGNCNFVAQFAVGQEQG